MKSCLSKEVYVDNLFFYWKGSCKKKFAEIPGAGTTVIVVGVVVAVMTMFFVSFKVKNEGCSTVTGGMCFEKKIKSGMVHL